jgi:hypothetical protein
MRVAALDWDLGEDRSVGAARLPPGTFCAVDLLRLRCSDPKSLSDRDLMRAAHNIASARTWLGPDRISGILREFVARYDLTWRQVGAVTGYPWQAAFRMAHR